MLYCGAILLLRCMAHGFNELDWAMIKSSCSSIFFSSFINEPSRRPALSAAQAALCIHTAKQHRVAVNQMNFYLKLQWRWRLGERVNCLREWHMNSTSVATQSITMCCRCYYSIEFQISSYYWFIPFLPNL